ncbi:hypothetical protein FFLO_06575 [Filobasidium floriforme]|uniref:Small ribosomal subunit protein mS29 n=1 Tax=Filobasidium floriforme TaxID=5210 RepID=A0A8K0JF35_9TREE|nr:mitochondrial ribosomal death-associated protein 3-domain-containing protein [Filobasidium floriforme]KAG7527804.1 hypothetical protein FFLO_06575 [Filobasidium floriforme]KAH8086367.1 mitochondrial ribosomal death-associated protein 3-domain-containing protein [Filobasidium floriforme]
MAAFYNRCIASSSRLAATQPSNIAVAAFSTSASSLAAAKGKKPGKAPVTKKKPGSFSKVRNTAVKGKEASSGGARGGETQTNQIDLTESVAAEFEPTVAVHAGVPTRFKKQNVDQLQAYGLPRRIAQEFQKGQAATVTRISSDKLISRLNSAAEKSSKETRLILNGSKGSGKSTIMLQAMSAAWQKGWIVIYLPRATELIDSTSPYAYNTTTQTFYQPALSSTLLSSMLAANKKALSEISLGREYETATGQRFQADEKLDALMARAAKDETISVGVLEIVFEVLAKQTTSPVLLAVDEAQALFMRSNYRTPHFDHLESYALSLPRLLLDYVSGRKSFDKGAILTSISLSTAQHAPPKEIYAAVPELSKAPVVTPYDKLDEHHVEAARGLEVFDVGDRLDLQEARGILDLCQQRKFVFGVTDEILLGKFAESGGNVNEFVRGLRSTLTV